MTEIEELRAEVAELRTENKRLWAEIGVVREKAAFARGMAEGVAAGVQRRLNAVSCTPIPQPQNIFSPWQPAQPYLNSPKSGYEGQL